MAIQQRGAAWRVYWNNPYTHKRESKTFAEQAQAVQYDALIKYRLRFEKERFLPAKQEPKEKEDESLEAVFYLYLRERQFAKRSLRTHLGSMKKALSMIGRKAVSAIGKRDLSAVLQAEIASGVSAKTVHNHMGTLATVIRWAYKRGIIDALPQFPERPRFAVPQLVPPSQDELARILEAAPLHVQRVIVIGAKLGLRVGPSELFRLRWEDVDLDRALVHVRAARKNPNEPMRDVPIMRTLLPVFRAWRDADAAAGEEYVIHYGHKPVESILLSWKATLRRAGITRRIRPYDLRHAFATDAIANGADMGTVSKLMGHANLEMIFKHYQHVATEQKRQAVESLPELDVSVVACAMNHVPDNLTRMLQ
jgi:integrase